MLLLMRRRMWLPFWALSAHCWVMLSFSSTNTPQVLLLRAALNPFSAQPVFVLGITLTRMQDLTFGLVEFYEVGMRTDLKPVQVPLDGLPSFQCINSTTQLGVTSNLAKGALNPTIHVANKDVKQRWSQYRPLRSATHHCSPLGHRSIDHNKLSATIQPIPYPLSIRQLYYNSFPGPRDKLSNFKVIFGLSILLAIKKTNM
ncbi:hypothetical protein llap_3480 [Limosa lapponica baueri]|uniref:Uncharacterized protein n=1 Tax=Limosa lapponica baueri TaxID=1758121 RepID=A0A2I0UJI8_LIMLA|nr:hypothetical protein llap_3480 [Limosa lapponica baueri]